MAPCHCLSVALTADGHEIEVLVNVYGDGPEAVVFQAMELGPKFRRYREENSNG